MKKSIKVCYSWVLNGKTVLAQDKGSIRIRAETVTRRVNVKFHFLTKAGFASRNIITPRCIGFCSAPFILYQLMTDNGFLRIFFRNCALINVNIQCCQALKLFALVHWDLGIIKQN